MSTGSLPLGPLHVHRFFGSADPCRRPFLDAEGVREQTSQNPERQNKDGVQGYEDNTGLEIAELFAKGLEDAPDTPYN